MGTLRRKWDKESVLISARKFERKYLWRAKEITAFNFAVRHGFLDEALSHMPTKKHWDKKSAIEDAKRFDLKSDWHRESRGAHEFARLNGFMDEACHHMERVHFWDKESAMKDAKLFNQRDEWSRNSSGAYEFARRNGFLDEACMHMKNLGGTSKLEIDLLNEIKTKYPNAKKKFFKKEINGDDVRFSLDIFIPEINKGVEFDGTYWHSLEAMRKSKPTWSEERLLQYHEIKDSFFSENYNILVFHIKEKDWRKNKEECVKQVFAFLEGL